MGIRSYIRDRKQVKASRAGEASEKLSKGDFSIFGGQNGATGGEWGDRPTPANDTFAQPRSKREAGAPDYHPKDPTSNWDANVDSYGRSGAMKNTEALSRNTNETPDEETARGARMRVSDTVTVLGEKWSKNHGRAPVSADARGRANAIKKQNADGGNVSALPSSDEAKKAGKRSNTSWDED